MKSRWFELKEKVIKYRQEGNSLRNIEKKFGIPKSTLSGWFRNISLGILNYLNPKRKFLIKNGESP